MPRRRRARPCPATSTASRRPTPPSPPPSRTCAKCASIPTCCRRRRPGRRLRRHRRRAPRRQSRAGAGPLAARRQLLERSQNARRRRQQHTGRPGWRESGLHRRTPPRRRRQQSAALLGTVGPAALRQGRQRAQHHPAARNHRSTPPTVKDGRIAEVAGALRQERAPLPHHAPSIFCDCTGDSRLGLEAGAEMRTGREARAEFGESLAPETARQSTRSAPASCSPRACITTPMPFTPAEVGAQGHQGAAYASAASTAWEYGYWWIEWGGDHDIIRDNERIRFELLSIVMGVWDYIKNSGDFPDSAQLGDGLGRHDARQARQPPHGGRPHAHAARPDAAASFDDAVAIGGWPMDDHPPERLRPPRPAAQHRAARRPRSTTSRCARSTAATSRTC